MQSQALVRSLLTLMLLATTAAGAADKPKKEGNFGAAKATGAYLTKDQLRACLKQQSRNGQQDEELQKEKAALGAARAELVARGEALNARLDALDRTNAEAVAAYNEQAQARDKQVDEHEAGVAAFNARVEAAKAEREGFVKGCGNRRYFEEDEIAIKKGK